MTEEDKKQSMKKCVNCGMCNANCPTYKATRDEKIGPRGRVKMVNNESEDETFFDCTLCKACEYSCPLNIKINFKNSRKKLKPTENNKKMIENIRKYGNPFGELKENEIPEDLYCC